MKFIQTIIAITVVISLSGCLNDTLNAINDASFSVRNHILATDAWSNNSDCYQDIEHRTHFKKGFLAGYKAHAASGATCPPALPPRCYWSVHYADFDGKQKQVAWYNGYEHGLFAAQQEGIEEESKIYTPIEAPPLCPIQAEHQVIEEGDLYPEGDLQNNVPPSPSDEIIPPAVPPVPSYDTSVEGNLNSDSKAGTEFLQPKLIPFFTENNQ